MGFNSGFKGLTYKSCGVKGEVLEFTTALGKICYFDICIGWLVD